ncbi:hypothetical protein ACHWQZ_G014712 [Mnemiopsis leidyi]
MIPDQGCKLPKPLVEKRRRARFNKSLEELKHLVPEMAHGAIRMDKADILELTVSHLKALQEECASDIDGNADPSYKDGFKRCIDETANVILNTPVPEEIKQHFITQLKVLSLGQENYSPLTPEYERNDLNKYNNLTNSGGMSLFPAVSPHSANTSPLHINSSHFDSDRQSAFNAVESRTVIKQEVHSPEQNSKVNGIWRPW